MAGSSSDAVGGCLFIALIIPFLFIKWLYNNIWLVLGIVLGIILLAVVIFLLITEIAESMERASKRKNEQRKFEERKKMVENRARKENQIAKEKALKEVANIYENSVKSLRDTKSITKLEKLRQEAEALILKDHLNAAGDIIKKIDERFSKLQRDSGELNQIVSEVWPTRELNITEPENMKKNQVGWDRNMISLDYALNALIDCPLGRERVERLSGGDAKLKHYDFLRIRSMSSKCNDKGTKKCNLGCKKSVPVYAD